MKKRIVIWGAGRFGQYIYEQIIKNSNVEVVCFVDKNNFLVGKKVLGLEVIQPKQIMEYKEKIDIILVAFINSIYEYKEFVAFNEIRIGFIDNYVLGKKIDLEQDLTKDSNIFWVDDWSKPLLRNLETNVVDYCNLNCKGCSHFSNLYKEGDMVTYENYCKDLLQIAKHINVKRLNLLGGETLLHERLIEYIRFARKVMPYTEIWIITNGLLLLKQKEEFFQGCIDNKIGIDISEYEPTSKIIDQIIELLERYNIKYNVRDNRGEFGKNIDLLGRANPSMAMSRCRESVCHFFRNGMLYKCPFEALGNKFFEHYEQEIRLNGGTNIYNENIDWNKVIYELENEPVDSCRYCGEEIKYKWGVSHNPVMEEWIIN